MPADIALFWYYVLVMNIDQYSVLLTLAVMALLAITFISMLAYWLSPHARSRMLSVEYTTYLKLVGSVAIISTIGALVYQFHYLTPVCAYCWWQRIFMFPIDIIVLSSLWQRIYKNEITIIILALIGSIFAAIHSYVHVQVAVLGNLLTLPCSSVGIIPSCTETPVLVWGLFTIPMMALGGFIAIIWLSYLAYRVRNRTSSVVPE